VSLQWVIIDTKVYNLSKFIAIHPGGAAVLLDADVGTLAGSDRGCICVHDGAGVAPHF
jgi:Cytochrome b5-like Heme/Steroid binding domain